MKKLEPVMRLETVVSPYTNPGFALDDVLYFDEAVVRLEKQPYPHARIVALYPAGAMIQPPEPLMPRFFSWENLCHLFVIGEK